MSKKSQDNSILTEEEYQKTKQKNKSTIVTLDLSAGFSKVNKIVKTIDSLFISEEEYQKRKKEKKENKIYLHQESKRIAQENKEIQKFTKKWVEEMAYMGLKNAMCETFALRNIKYQPYGFSCNIHSPKGLTLAEFESEKNVNIIQDNLMCLFRFKKIPKSNHIEAKFITKDIPLVDFVPHKLSPYELYMSTGIDGQPIVSNMLNYPHVLVQGSTGMGKTKFIDLILVNLITTETPDDVGLFIIQADKYDRATCCNMKSIA